MSSNRLALIAAAALCLAGCSTVGRDAGDSTALTPTERFAIQVTPHPQEVRLAAHPNGLSANQAAALSAFARTWLQVEGGQITVQAPVENGDEGAVYRTSEAARRFLVEQGVTPDRIRTIGYRPAGDGEAPIIVGYMAYSARGPDCSASWANLTASADNNNLNPNFGCAVTANVAASLSNPGDLVAPRGDDPVDPNRRSQVLEHYRNGENTSSVRDQQASGAVSHAVN